MVGGGRRPSPAKERGGGLTRAKDGFGRGSDSKGSRGNSGLGPLGGEGGIDGSTIGGAFNALIGSGLGSADQTMAELAASPSAHGTVVSRLPGSSSLAAGMGEATPMALEIGTVKISGLIQHYSGSDEGASNGSMDASPMLFDQPRDPVTGRFAATSGKAKSVSSKDNVCMDISDDRNIAGLAGPNVSNHGDANIGDILCHPECREGVCSYARKDNSFSGTNGKQQNDLFWERPREFIEDHNWPELQGSREKRPNRPNISGESNPLNLLGGQTSWKKKTYDLYEKKENLAEFSTDNGVSIRLDKNAVEVNKQKLQGALVGRLLGRRIPFFFLKRELERRWMQFGLFRTMMVSIDCFMCIFETSEARDAALMGGPWFIAGHIIGLDRWSPKFNPHSLDGFTSPVWVRLPNLPLVCWDKTNIGRIGAAIGEPLWIDSYTSGWGRSAYARICVKADLGKKLPNGVWVIDDDTKFFQPVEYEGISVLCYNCGMVGHREPNCPSAQARNTRMAEPAIPPPQPNPVAAQSSDNGTATATTAEHTLQDNPSDRETTGILNADSSSPINTDHHLDCLTDLTSQGLNKGYGPWTTVANRKKSKKPVPNARPPAAPAKLKLLPNDRAATPSPPVAEHNPFKVPSSPSWEPANCKHLGPFTSNSKEVPSSSKKGRSSGTKKNNKKDFVAGKITQLPSLPPIESVDHTPIAQPSLVMDGQPVDDRSGDFCEVSIRKRKKRNNISNNGGDASPLVA